VRAMIRAGARYRHRLLNYYRPDMTSEDAHAHSSLLLCRALCCNWQKQNYPLISGKCQIEQLRSEPSYE